MLRPRPFELKFCEHQQDTMPEEVRTMLAKHSLSRFARAGTKPGPTRTAIWYPRHLS